MVKATTTPSKPVKIESPLCPSCGARLEIMHVVQHWEFMGRCRDVLACPSCGATLGYAIPRPGAKLPCISCEGAMTQT